MWTARKFLEERAEAFPKLTSGAKGKAAVDSNPWKMGVKGPRKPLMSQTLGSVAVLYAGELGLLHTLHSHDTETLKVRLIDQVKRK